jgi:hypothetical protein
MIKHITGEDRIQILLFVGSLKETILGHNNFMAIYDEGYHTRSEFDYTHNLAIDV